VKRERIVVMAAAACLSVGWGVVGVAEGAGAAQAMSNSSGKDFIYPKGVCTDQACSNQWCPGMLLPCGSDCTGHPQYSGWDMRPGSNRPPKSVQASSKETPGGARARATGRPSAYRGSKSRWLHENFGA
jgi:hypothetical protein